MYKSNAVHVMRHVLPLFHQKTVKLKAEARLDLLRQVGVAVDTWLKSSMNQVCLFYLLMKIWIPWILLYVCVCMCHETCPWTPLTLCAYSVGNGGAGEWTLGKLHHSRSFVVGKMPLHRVENTAFFAYPADLILVVTKLYYGFYISYHTHT